MMELIEVYLHLLVVDLKVKLHSQLNLGKAYVEGYEIETMGSQIVSVDKPRTFDREVDRPIQTPVGNYVLVENVTNIPDINVFEELTLYNRLGGNPGGGTQVGTARVRAFALHDGDYTGTITDVRFKLGIFDVI